MTPESRGNGIKGWAQTFAIMLTIVGAAWTWSLANAGDTATMKTMLKNHEEAIKDLKVIQAKATETLALTSAMVKAHDEDLKEMKTAMSIAITNQTKVTLLLDQTVQRHAREDEAKFRKLGVQP